MARDAASAGDQLRIGLAHLLREIGDQPVEERLLLPELVAVADGAADDAAQHVAAALVAGITPSHDQEGAGADVIGDHVQRGDCEILGMPVSRAAALISVWNRSIS